MYEQEIELQIKNFKNGANYREVKDSLSEKYDEVETVQIATQAYSRYTRLKANRFIIVGMILLATTYLYHFLFQEFKPAQLIIQTVIGVIPIVSGLYLKYRLAKK